LATYTYKREDGTTFDHQQAMADDALAPCPTTGQPVERVMQPFGSLKVGKRFYREGTHAGAFPKASRSPRGAAPPSTTIRG
jgi:predicted nucleic acid-binding Zn ribbon protein